MDYIEITGSHSQVSNDVQRSRIAAEIYPKDVLEEDIGGLKIPAKLTLLSNLGDECIARYELKPRQVGGWLMALSNGRIPDGFSSLDEFYATVENLKLRGNEQPYYKVVAKKRKRLAS